MPNPEPDYKVYIITVSNRGEAEFVDSINGTEHKVLRVFAGEECKAFAEGFAQRLIKDGAN